MTRRQVSNGFALPTVIITSVVMFGVLVAILSMVTSTSTSLSTQYFESLAADAAESAASAAETCLEEDVMTTSTVLMPNTDCTGTVVSGRSPYVMTSNGADRPYRTKYTAQLDSVTSTSSIVKVTGTVERIRPATGVSYQTLTKTTMLASTRVVDTNGDRPSQRFWYLGNNAYLDFGVSGSTLPSTGKNTDSFFAAEGITTISDQSGKLQFMSDGLSIWDKNGNKVASNINGGSSASQAVAAFPLNKTRTKYAVVSNTGQAEQGPGALYVSTLTINSDGTITVGTQNTPLTTETGYTYEALGAMPNNDGSGYFIYTMNKNNKIGTIYRFFLKLDGSGNAVTISDMTKMTIDPAPTTCALNYPAGTRNPLPPAMYGAAGTINFSKDYKRMVLLSSALSCSGTTNGSAYLYSTDSVTGDLALQASWTTHGDGAGSAYSADFSPNERFIYVSSIYPSYLVRYNIQDLSNVQGTEWKIGAPTDFTSSTSASSGGQVRRGPDDRMYIANRAQYQAGTSVGCKISYINNPDAADNIAGSTGIDLKKDALTLANNSCSSWGLPQTATVFKPRIVLY